MRHMLFAAVGALAVSGVASAQQPQPQPQPQPAAPAQPAAGPRVIAGGAGCTNCGTASGPVGRGFSMSGTGYGGSNCQLGQACQSGCGSLRSDLAFQFGSCKNFFAPCGPTYAGHGHGHGGLFGRGACPTGPVNAPWGTGFGCPRAYDSYTNH